MSFPKKTSRREFLKQLALSSAGVVAAPSVFGSLTEAHSNTKKNNAARKTRPRAAGAKPVWNLKTEPTEIVRVGIIGLGRRGLGFLPDDAKKTSVRGDYYGLLGEILNVPFAHVTAVCDKDFARAEKAAQICSLRKPDVPAPEIFAGTEDAWAQLCVRADVDVVYIATPWALHAPMATFAMKSGKHAFVEVPAALSVDECWLLVDTSEQTQKHCVMLENCCFGDEEMFVLNMARQGVFGKLTHAECAYIHDLRALLFTEKTEGDWRRGFHRMSDGNLYPTHGLGPVCLYFDVNRGDALDFLVSVSAPEAGLSAFRNREAKRGNATAAKFLHEKYVCGDVNSTLIKTALGRTILLQHDVVSPRPYSRINLLTGTEATFAGYPPRLALDVPEKYDIAGSGADAWLNERDFSKMRNMYRSPLWAQLRERIRKSGYGGADFVMNFRLLDCIRRGITPDITVYDAAAWSCIAELSAQSVAQNSAPVHVPDFMRGDWTRS